MQKTLLSTILSRMDRTQTLNTIETQFKVRDIDEAIRTLRRDMKLPWALKKGTLKVFQDVLEYPIADDHDQLAYLDSSKDKSYLEKMQGVFTSFKEFYENPDGRDDIADIWDSGDRFLGVRYSGIRTGSQEVESGETSDNYTASADAVSVEDETVLYKKGNGSIKVNVTESTDIATVECDFTNINDSEYKEKYFFVWVYLKSIPTSIDLKFGNDSSNYLTENLTTQFSGQSFKAEAWNLLAINLDEATEVGTITPSTFSKYFITINGVSTGAYYIDRSYLRGWELLDYWYYSRYSVMLTGSSVADQEYFFNSSEVYSTDSELVGDSEWIDVIMYEAMLTGIDEKENEALAQKIRAKKAEAWQKLGGRYPDLTPLITTTRWVFSDDPLSLI